MPTNLCSGDRTTVHHLLRFLSERHEVVFCTPVPDAKTAATDHLVAPYCERVETFQVSRIQSMFNCAKGVFGKTPLQTRFFYSPIMRKRIAQIVDAEEIDLVYGYHLRSAAYLQDLSCPTVLDLKPVQTLNLDRMRKHVKSVHRRWLYDLEYQRVRQYEPKAAGNVDACLVAGERDRRELQGVSNVIVNPHGLDVDYFCPDTAVEKQLNSLVFTGRIGYEPNHDAITYFCEEILPIVRRSIPDVKLAIVGKDPRPEIQKLDRDPNIEVTGFVEDIRPYMQKSQLAINPLRIGAGMQNKVIEAMAMGIPSVVTPVANEGIQAIPDEHIVVRDTPEAFAKATVDLLQDDALRQQLGAAARDFVVRHWSWERHFLDAENILQNLVDEQAAGVAEERSLHAVQDA